ncbi:sugar transferase [Arthrobacter sp. zg-Y820]|uniref:sugar transferase n=1 Tax=unclassified Arthrobacter TaxID=235627 RepID=UPI001E4D4A40|nr:MULTISPECIES: sugar transferase [unclassified Arthrobacter]MCC9197988.1 sugar transferase [Arthrobacter sp. zg-Y820]MDK1280855.1 sugar transferase [Arthrobacter sp. zg.Y820]MDK1360161.1 sugar transferase [Arthrobacter sp. zg-Y1219]WIB10334.1 sugar transferase [Arthrobacter sp. zg-Y820]
MTEVKDAPARLDLTLPVPFTFPDYKSFTPVRRRLASDSVRETNRYRKILLAFDLAVVTSAVAVAHLTRFGVETQYMSGGGNLNIPYIAVSAGIWAAWAVSLAIYRTRDARIVGTGADEYRRVTSATVVVMGLIAVFCLALQVDIARGYFALAFPIGLGGLLIFRFLLRQWLAGQRRKGRYLSKVIILGKPKDVRYVANQIQRRDGSAYRVIGAALTTPGDKELCVNGKRIPVVADRDTVVGAVRQLRADAVIVAGRMKGGSSYVQKLGWQLEESATQLILTTGLTNVAGPRIHARPVEGLPLMHVELPQYAGGRHMLKRGLDMLLSGGALVALIPVFAVLAVLIRRDSPGPVIFRQERVGRGGEPFEMLKFRSMVQTAEDDLAGLLDRNEGSGVLFKMQHDPRVTSVGRWMRKYSLDELPQLWNVFLGHMSLVGPRPPLPREVAQYGGQVHRRLYIKPGLTGMWQINGRSELNWKDGVRLDLYYVENWSLAGDLIILWRTVQMLRRPVGAY